MQIYSIEIEIVVVLMVILMINLNVKYVQINAKLVKILRAIVCLAKKTVTEM